MNDYISVEHKRGTNVDNNGIATRDSVGVGRLWKRREMTCYCNVMSVCYRSVMRACEIIRSGSKVSEIFVKNYLIFLLYILHALPTT